MDHPSPHMVAFLDALADRPDCTLEVLYCNGRLLGEDGEPRWAVYPIVRFRE